MKKCDCNSPIRCSRLRCRVQALLDSKGITPRGAEHSLAKVIGSDQKLPRGFVSDLIDGKKDKIYKYRSELAKVLGVDEGFLFEGIIPRRTAWPGKRIPGIPRSEQPQPKLSRRERLEEEKRRNQKSSAVGSFLGFDQDDAPNPDDESDLDPRDLLHRMHGRYRENRFIFRASCAKIGRALV